MQGVKEMMQDVKKEQKKFKRTMEMQMEEIEREIQAFKSNQEREFINVKGSQDCQLTTLKHEQKAFAKHFDNMRQVQKLEMETFTLQNIAVLSFSFTPWAVLLGLICSTK